MQPILNSDIQSNIVDSIIEGAQNQHKKEETNQAIETLTASALLFSNDLSLCKRISKAIQTMFAERYLQPSSSLPVPATSLTPTANSLTLESAASSDGPSTASMPPRLTPPMLPAHRLFSTLPFAPSSGATAAKSNNSTSISPPPFQPPSPVPEQTKSDPVVGDDPITLSFGGEQNLGDDFVTVSEQTHPPELLSPEEQVELNQIAKERTRLKNLLDREKVEFERKKQRLEQKVLRKTVDNHIVRRNIQDKSS